MRYYLFVVVFEAIIIFNTFLVAIRHRIISFDHVVNDTLCIGECPSNSPFLKNNGAEAPKGARPIVFKEWRDTRTFSNLNSTHCTLLIWLIINLVTKQSLCIVSKVQSIKLFAPCGTLKVQRVLTIDLHHRWILNIYSCSMIEVYNNNKLQWIKWRRHFIGWKPVHTI